MGNNFRKMTILSQGTYYLVDRKPEFHQTACKHEFIKGQIIKNMAELTATEIAAAGNPMQRAVKYAGLIGKKPIGRLPKTTNICKKCGKVKTRND